MIRKGFEQWCDQNYMKLNIDKAQYVIFQKNRDQTRPTLKIKGTTIAPVEEMKYRGIVFDCHMTFTSHVNKITAKAGRRLNTIRSLRILYKSCIEPIIKYGAEIWITSLKTQEGTRRLDRVSRLAGLTIAGLDKTTSLETATSLAHITPLSVIATAILLRTAPQAYNREEVPHRLPDPTTHCTP